MISTVGRAALLGAATGARSMIGLAALAAATPPAGTPQAGTPRASRPGWPGWLGGPWGRSLAAAAAAGELLLDKSPALPGRTAPPVLAGRLAMGAFVAVVLARRRGEPPVLPMLAAGAAVVAASVAGQAWRRYALERGHATAGALVEDLVAAGLAARGARAAG